MSLHNGSNFVKRVGATTTSTTAFSIATVGIMTFAQHTESGHTVDKFYTQNNVYSIPIVTFVTVILNAIVLSVGSLNVVAPKSVLR